MLLRVLGAASIMVGCVGMGLYLSLKEDFRAGELAELKKALLILSSEIDFMYTPLHEACANIGVRVRGTVKQLFQQFGSLLDQDLAETAYQQWVQALTHIKGKTFMVEEDFKAIEGFGKTLGYLDKQLQQSAINYTINYLDQQVAQLHSQSHKTKRMYRSLGVIGGLLLVIILW